MTSTSLYRNVRAKDIRITTNVRPSISNESMASMMASIRAKGVLQNIVLAPDSKGSNNMAMVAGFTRLSAVLALIDLGELPNDYEIPALIRMDMVAGDVEALEVALSENIIRTSMDYVDECAAMLVLAKAGKTEAQIAGVFGYRPRTVRERLLIAALIPEALDVIRSGARSMEWARALTMADATFQARVVQDITSNPNAWAEGADIRAHLTRATIPAEHALFDAEEYTSTLIADFFEGDKFADISAFWKLQNEAIDARVADLEGQGYTVTVLRNDPFPDWRYTDAPAGVKGEAIVEVMADGKVRVFEGKVRIAEAGAHTEGDIGLASATDLNEVSVASWEVRPTGRVLDYAAAQKSAILQAHLSGDFEAALRYATLALMGAQGSAFSAQPFSFPGAVSIRNGGAWNNVNADTAEETAIRNANPETVAFVTALDRAQLERLFAIVVARRAGFRRSAPDSNALSLPNAMGAGVDVRAWWTPDLAFFNLLPTEDLRRLCVALVPKMNASRVATQKRNALVRTLNTAFNKASNGLLDAATNARLNAWVPGVMSFPAIVATTDEPVDATVDAEDALFGAF